MKVVLFGATGMVGQGVLRECLLDPDVESVLAVVRNAILPQHDKLRKIVHQNVSDLGVVEDRLSGYDACFFLSRRLVSGDEGGDVSARDIRSDGLGG